MRRPGVVLALLVLAATVVCAAVPDLVAAARPDAVDPFGALRPPGADHLFGTDQLGRDLFARVVHGTRRTVLVAGSACVASLLIGSLVGVVSGMLGGWLDALLMRAVDVLLAFPALLLSLTVIGVLGSSPVNVAVAVAVAGVAPYCRVVRAQVLHVRTRPFVAAATVSGVRPVAVLLRHIVPNAAGPVLVLALMSLGVALLAASSLSFLGFGPHPPDADWGSLAASGRDYVGTAWWLTAFPGAVVVAVVSAVTAVHRAVTRR
ncbi:ABC transporter permease [Saccharothrix violaceirubra]|uniref:Peptide/nickel transport system permease protein n=1 Tax=Saccharothrix violaceirubra TaxID=413306 RepID=A0A7W7T671_9PSEU|nr:ABC transporter permease [Saccharothrix violaceirubra]MBB4967304.1 peptide/nickel transport system permease protein [Saccharothrix violaceirubra]